MSAFRLRICVWCLRNFIFLFVINAYISNGLSREFNEAVVKKLFIGDYPEKSNASKMSLVHSGTTSSNSKSKINNANNKYVKNDSRKQRTSGNLRLKRNALLADEDLFEFMVRIANTPAEWERIRRVLSRIKQEEPDDSSPTIEPVSSAAPLPHVNIPRNNSTSMPKLQNWPSSDWIKNLIDNATNEDLSYLDDEELDESEYDVTDGMNETSLNSISIQRTSKNATMGQTNATTDNIKLIANSNLPNFVYRQVVPQSHNLKNSAYIGVSIISDNSENTRTTTKIEPDENVAFPQNTHLELETKRRHSKKKLYKT